MACAWDHLIEEWNDVYLYEQLFDSPSDIRYSIRFALGAIRPSLKCDTFKGTLHQSNYCTVLVYFCSRVVCAYFQMTRSAPPERNVQANVPSESGRHTAFSRRPKSKPNKDNVSVCLEDIYQFAERERLNYSTSCRRQNLAHAQSQTQFFRHEQSVVPSRPNTSASRHMNASKRDNGTPISAWSEPVLSRPSSIVPHTG